MKALLVASAVLILTVASCKDAGCPAVPGTRAIALSAKDSIVERNRSTALASVLAMNRHDYDETFKDYAPNAIAYGDSTGGKPIRGIDSIRTDLDVFIKAFPDFHGKNFVAIADNNHAAVFADWTGTFKFEMMGLKPTGRSFSVKDVDCFTFDSRGKIIAHRTIQSNQTINNQVGIK